MVRRTVVVSVSSTANGNVVAYNNDPMTIIHSEKMNVKFSSVCHLQDNALLCVQQHEVTQHVLPITEK